MELRGRFWKETETEEGDWIKCKREGKVAVLLYVDETVLTGKTEEEMLDNVGEFRSASNSRRQSER